MRRTWEEEDVAVPCLTSPSPRNATWHVSMSRNAPNSGNTSTSTVITAARRHHRPLPPPSSSASRCRHDVVTTFRRGGRRQGRAGQGRAAEESRGRAGGGPEGPGVRGRGGRGVPRVGHLCPGAVPGELCVWGGWQGWAGGVGALGLCAMARDDGVARFILFDTFRSYVCRRGERLSDSESECSYGGSPVPLPLPPPPGSLCFFAGPPSASRGQASP